MATIIQLLLFSVFLVTLKKGRKLSSVILAVFFASKVVGLTNHLILRLNLASFLLYFAFVPFAFLYGPSLYYFVLSVLDKNFSLKKKDAVHLLPFIICFSYLAMIYHFRSAASKAQIWNAYLDQFPVPAIVIIAVLNLLIVGYITASFLALRSHRRELENMCSTIDRARLRWIRFILSGFSFIWALDMVQFALRTVASSPLVLNSAAVVLLFIFANVAVFKGLREPEVFNGAEEMPKYHRSRLTRLEGEGYLRRLLLAMRSEKPYLDAGLTIVKLGRRLSIPPRYLSQVINEHLKVNFYDFVNGYRVEEAKRLLDDGSHGQKNLLEILYEAGFNTKSAFNRAFKKHTGMTPSRYKSRASSRSDRSLSPEQEERP
jgi:AraC-like DNA-binding protein